MAMSFDCKVRLVKQNPFKETQPRASTKAATSPSPIDYDLPPLIGGKGYSKKRRAPQYQFGLLTPSSFYKPATHPKAPLLQVQPYHYKGGRHRIPGGRIGKEDLKLKCPEIPGPDAYVPAVLNGNKPRAPKYTIRKAARPPYQPWDTWTPSPNMYCPPLDIYKRKAPATEISGRFKDKKPEDLPGPGSYDSEKFNYVKKRPPKYSIYPYRPPIDYTKFIPGPTAFCEFKAVVKSIPAFSFGIKHSPYVGQDRVYLKDG